MRNIIYTLFIWTLAVQGFAQTPAKIEAASKGKIHLASLEMEPRKTTSKSELEIKSLLFNLKKESISCAK